MSAEFPISSEDFERVLIEIRLKILCSDCIDISVEGKWAAKNPFPLKYHNSAVLAFDMIMIEYYSDKGKWM